MVSGLKHLFVVVDVAQKCLQLGRPCEKRPRSETSCETILWTGCIPADSVPGMRRSFLLPNPTKVTRSVPNGRITACIHKSQLWACNPRLAFCICRGLLNPAILQATRVFVCSPPNHWDLALRPTLNIYLRHTSQLQASDETRTQSSYSS